MFRQLWIGLYAFGLLLTAQLNAAGGDGLIARLEPTGSITDRAKLLSSETEKRLRGILDNLHVRTGASLVVVTLPSMEGGQIDDFTNRLFEEWGVGDADKDNGVMLLVAVKERKMRIEVNTVKGFAAQERTVLTEVTALRSQWAKAGTVAEKAQASSGLEAALGRLMVISERYPELKSNQNFLRLQDELAGTENRVSVERRRYNEAVQAYNTTIRTFPAVIIANYLDFEKKDAYFEAVIEAETAPVVEFE